MAQKYIVGVSRVTRLVERGEIEVEADNAEDAAALAYELVNDQDGTAVVWREPEREVEDFGMGIPRPAAAPEAG